MEITDLDEYFVNFAKFVLKVQSLFDAQQERADCTAQRKEMCDAAGVKMREWSPETLKTYVNRLGVLYKMTKPPKGIVPKAKSQFPTFVRFTNSAASR